MIATLGAVMVVTGTALLLIAVSEASSYIGLKSRFMRWAQAGGLIFLVGLALAVCFSPSPAQGEEMSEPEEICLKVHRRTGNRVACSYRGEEAHLVYRGGFSYWGVRWSGRHGELLRTLCQHAEVVVETKPSGEKKQHACSSL